MIQSRAAYCTALGLVLVFILRSSSRHFLYVTIRNVEEHTGALLTAVRANNTHYILVMQKH